jgi:hypothetical protein
VAVKAEQTVATTSTQRRGPGGVDGIEVDGVAAASKQRVREI